MLSIDFDYMRAGRPRKNFLRQIDDLAELARKVNADGDERLLPFIGVDPRREGLERLVREYIEKRGFRGIKLYPSLGYFPDDERLWGIYEYAQERQIPITTHCIPKNKNHYRGRIPQAHRDKARVLPGWDVRDQYNSYHFARWYNHPHWYGELLKRFPELKINFGHFGGKTEWDKYLDRSDSKLAKNEDRDWNSRIRKLLKDYPNTYADISYTVYDRALYPFLKVLLNTSSRDMTKRDLLAGKPGSQREITEKTREMNIRDKLLFGTDFYMLQKDYSERRFSIDLRGYLSDEEYWLIAETNPRRFLAMKP